MESVRFTKKLGSRRGVALLLSIVFVMLFSTLAVSMAAMSGSNMQISKNVRETNRAFESAQSGLEVFRYWLNGVTISGYTPVSDRMETLCTELQAKLVNNGVTNFAPVYDNFSNTVTIPNVAFDDSGRTFSAILSQIDGDTVQAIFTGNATTSTKRIAVTFSYDTVGNTVFNYGIATKGPLRTKGSVDVDGLNEAIEASVYIESEFSNLALEMIGKSSIAGDVSIVNPIASVDIGNSSSVGGEKGDDAMDHVYIGVPPSDFPVPQPTSFRHLATNTLDVDMDTSSDAVLENIIIPAGMNPKFSGHATLKGIIYIEQPNVVEFTGTADVIGMIVAEGSLDAPSDDNLISFRGNVSSAGVESLPDAGFSEIKKKTGTFILAPGFDVSFGGSFDSLNGVIAASGVEFFGNAGGTINGSVVNYGHDAMTLDGNTDLIFNRSGISENPAGFEPSKMLQYRPLTYSELL